MRVPYKGSLVSLRNTIDDLDLSARSYNCLKRANIETIDQLLNTSKSALEHVRNFGKVSTGEVISKLAAYGYSLKKDDKEEGN